MVLEVVLVVLEVVLVVLEVTGPQMSLVKFQTRLSLRPDLYSPAPPIAPSARSETAWFQLTDGSFHPTVDVICVASTEELLLQGFPLKGTLNSMKNRSLLSLLSLLKTS